MYKNCSFVLGLLIMTQLNGFGQKRPVPPPPPPPVTKNKTIKKTSSASEESNLTDEKIFSKVEIESSYPGGFRAWISYLEKNLNGSLPSDNGAPSGKYTIIIRFIVAKDGSLSNVLAESHSGYGMEEECIRVIKNSGNWTPAIQDGKKVISYKRQPITFVIEDIKPEPIPKRP
jgi:protein TonB